MGILAVGVWGHLVIERIGRWRALWTGAFGMSVSALILIAGRSAALTIGAAFCMGLVGSLILVMIPSLLSDMHEELRAVALSEANVVASLVATAAPLMVGWLRKPAGRLAAGLGGGGPGAAADAAGIRAPGAPKKRDSSDGNRQGAGKPLPRLFWAYWVALVLGVSVEFCMISWSADYMEKSLGMPR